MHHRRSAVATAALPASRGPLSLVRARASEPLPEAVANAARIDPSVLVDPSPPPPPRPPRELVRAAPLPGRLEKHAALINDTHTVFRFVSPTTGQFTAFYIPADAAVDEAVEYYAAELTKVIERRQRLNAEARDR